MGEYRLVRRCSSCKHKLDANAVVYRHGVCLHCGVQSPPECVGPHGHRLVQYTESVEYVPTLWDRLKNVFTEDYTST